MPRVDLSVQRVWEQQPEEDAEAYQAFVVFRELQQPASIEQACRKALGREPEPEVIVQWAQWAEDWAWVARAELYWTSPEMAAKRARDLTERWRRAKEFYENDSGVHVERKGLAKLLNPLLSLFQRRPRRRESWFRRWSRQQAMHRQLKAQQSAAIRASKARHRTTLAQRWTLLWRRRKSAAESEEARGPLAWWRKLMTFTRTMAARYTMRFVLIYGVLCLVVGAFLGMLFLRWRRIRFQNAVVFTVNEASIRRNEFQSRLETSAAKGIMQEMIERNLRRQFAKAKKAFPSDKEVEARVAEDRKDPGFAKSLASAGMTLDEYKEAVRDEMAQANLMAEGVTVTDEEVRKYYQRNIDKKNPQARFYVPETIQVAVIGTRTREAALAALEDLKDGVPWEEAARKHSIDVSAFSGGVLPPFARGRTMAAMIPGMESTIFALEPGQRIGPVKFGEGWWIIQCRDKTPEKTLPFEMVKERARLWARMEKGVPKNGRRIASEYAAFQKRAKVQVFDPYFRSLMAR